MITVRIPTPLRTLTGGNDQVEVEGGTVREAFEALEKKAPGIKDRLLDDKGVRRFVNVYVGDEDVRFLDGLDTKLAAGTEISIVPGDRRRLKSGMDRFVRQRRLAELGEAGQARLSAASHRVAGADGALTELVYLHRAGFRVVSVDSLATPRPFAHAECFHHAASRRHAAGAWRALRAITELLERPSS